MDTMKKDEIQKQMTQISEISDAKLEENQSIEDITYYHDFSIGNSNIAKENVYIVKITNQKERETGDKSEKKNNEIPNDSDALEKYTTYEIYDKNNNLIATVNKDGKVKLTDEYLQEIQKSYGEYINKLNLDDIDFGEMAELSNKDLRLSKEELAEYKEKQSEKEDNQEKTKEEEKEEEKTSEKENEQEEKEETAKVLGIEPEDIKSISSIDPKQKVTDKETLEDIMPEAAQYEELKIALTNPTEKSNGTFTIIGVKENGEREVMNSIEPIEGTSGDKSVISMNEDGSMVTEKQVKGLFQINSRSRTDGIAVSIGSYGMMNIDYVQNVRDKETRRAIPIRTKETENQRIATSAVREQGGDPITEVEKEGKNFRDNDIKSKSMDGIDIDESDGKTSLENLKEKIKEEALERDDMSSSELKEFINEKLEEEGLDLSDEERKNTIEEIREEVIDESRFPTR